MRHAGFLPEWMFFDAGIHQWSGRVTWDMHTCDMGKQTNRHQDECMFQVPSSCYSQSVGLRTCAQVTVPSLHAWKRQAPGPKPEC
jgi:hypothetical protein